MPKGYGFVKFASIESQDKVLRDKEVFIDGRVTQVSQCYFSFLISSNHGSLGINFS